MLLGHFLVFRGETRRGAELADLALVHYPANKSVIKCFSFVLQIFNSKINKWGKKQFGGAIKHKDPLLCCFSALGLYFFYR